jgi:hypothetical protein
MRASPRTSGSADGRRVLNGSSAPMTICALRSRHPLEAPASCPVRVKAGTSGRTWRLATFASR